MNFVALACNDLGIEPPLNYFWYPIRNPYAVGGHTKERDISISVRWFEKNRGVRISWPGDDVKVDFASWYDGEAGAKAERGADVTVTATVPLETVGRGGSARIFLPSGQALNATIPAGTEDGEQIRLRGQGQPGRNGGASGDALITIKIAPRLHFTVSGREAARLYKLADDQGDAAAQCTLARIYEYSGLPSEEREAVRLYRCAAGQGDAVAQYSLALFYAHGHNGLPRDEHEAARLYKLAASQGHPAAQCNLGEFHNLGRGGLPKSPREAARLFKLAADQGNAVAQDNLAELYARGRGVPQDYLEAAQLYKLAADQGSPSATEALAKLRGKY